ncbi:hypothetical protein HN935_04050 [archaeon]|jgi:hypothetical protein|nr:hypothetical protein [archaeon]
MVKMKNQKICEEIRKVLSGEKEVLAIFNNGSSVVGLDTLGSDVDFVAILKKGEDEKRVLKILRKTFRTFKNEENPEVDVEEQFDVFGRRADVTFISLKDMENKINSFYKKKENLLELQHFIKHKIIDSVAVYDPGKFLVKWKKEIERYPKKIFDEVFNYSIKSIKENLFYWKHHQFRNEFQFCFEEWEMIEPICRAIYAKNRTLFMLPYKRLSTDLKMFKPNIEKEMYGLIKGTNTPTIIKKKIKIVERILDKLEE